VEAVIVPEPSDEERQAVLEALGKKEEDPYGSAWREAALQEGAESEEP
jgi:hypothetical protein